MAKVGDKFVIKITEVMKTSQGNLYRANGMKTCVFDDLGLTKLKNYDLAVKAGVRERIKNVCETLDAISAAEEEMEDTPPGERPFKLVEERIADGEVDPEYFFEG